MAEDEIIPVEAAPEQTANGEAQPPVLPAKVVDTTSQRYLDAYRRITGAALKIQGTGAGAG